jgi:hypothetical protein
MANNKPKAYRACIDPECGKLFEVRSDQPRRLFCYNPDCAARRKKRNNQAKMERVKALKAAGKWETHLREVAGIGKGGARSVVPNRKKEPLVRKCLKCDKSFEVPEYADDHICGDCHVENDELLAEYSEEALGLVPIPPRSTISNCRPGDSIEERFGFDGRESQ